MIFILILGRRYRSRDYYSLGEERQSRRRPLFFFVFSKMKPDRVARVAFDLSSDLYEWASQARPLKCDTFFSSRTRGTGHQQGIVFELKADHSNSELKAVTTVFEMDSARFFISLYTHRGSLSLCRYEGARLYRPMDRPLVFLKYIRLASKAFNDAISLMCDVHILPAKEVDKISSTGCEL